MHWSRGTPCQLIPGLRALEDLVPGQHCWQGDPKAPTLGTTHDTSSLYQKSGFACIFLHSWYPWVCSRRCEPRERIIWQGKYLYFQSKLSNSTALTLSFYFQVSIAVGLAAFACVLLVVLFIMINKYGRRSKFGMKGRCSLLPLAGGTFQDCQVLIEHVERCCGFVHMLSVLTQSVLKRTLSKRYCYLKRTISSAGMWSSSGFCWKSRCFNSLPVYELGPWCAASL